MLINLAQPIGCGNAVRLVVQPRSGETRWRILRNETGTFPDAFDPASFLVHDGCDRFLTDARLLVNGVAYHYAVFGEMSPGVWSAPALTVVTPGANFKDISPDAQEIVRERIDGALQSMIQRGKLRLSKPAIPVMSIPFYQQGTDLPVVTVLYGNGSSAVRGLGEMVAQDVQTDEGWIGSQGWHSAVTLEIAVWSLNADERNTLRRALEAAIAANLAVFGDLGLDMVEVQSIRDIEDTQSMNAPVFQTFMQFGCQVGVVVTDDEGQIEDVQPTWIGV